LAENRDTQSLISGSGVRHCLGLEISYRHFEENRTAAMKISYYNQPRNPQFVLQLFQVLDGQ